MAEQRDAPQQVPAKPPTRCQLPSCPFRISGQDWILVPINGGGGLHNRMGFCSSEHARLASAFLGSESHEVVTGSGVDDEAG